MIYDLLTLPPRASNQTKPVLSVVSIGLHTHTGDLG
jgi:hypothetical protein